MVFFACRLFFASLWFTTCAFSFQEDQDKEAQRDAITAKRFLAIVEKNPQRGTALEKVFAYHLQLGTLDSFVADLEKRAKENPSDGVAWMLLGLFESQRRMDTQAIQAFTEAEKLRPIDPLPAYYRGQCLLRIGEPTQAVGAFEIAIERKPSRIVLLEVFELLGRTHQRQNRNDLAIDAWKRLEENFPNDLRVLEQIATIQSQEGANQDGLTRYERLIQLTKDVYQRAQFRVEAAQLRVKLGASERGMLELQAVLGELRPDSWLYRDVQRKIEEVFLKTNDIAGLISYYEHRIEKMPDDIESMIRLSKFLVSSVRIAEANQWLVKAIDRAPSRTDLRKAYIDQLIVDQQFALAIEEYEKLSKFDPKNSDVLRDWGKLVLRDTLRPSDAAKHEASNIWNKIIENNPDDALTHIQVADLLQLAELPEEAKKHMERAIELQPDEPQYREFLGDLLFRQNHLEQAFQVWDAIADGTRRNADSVMRLAEIYDHAQQHDRAAKLATEACVLADQNSSMFVRAARLQKKADQIDEALNSLSNAEKLADNNDQREFITDERIRILEASNRLKSTTESLQAQLASETKPSMEQLQLLARYLVQLRRWKEANAIVLKALQSDEVSLSMLRLSADIAEGLGDADQAIQSLRKLADSERRKRQEYLERIARIQVRQQKWPDAVKTAEEVVAAVPSKIEGYEFMAHICSQAKNHSLAIATLRKAMRIDPNSTRLTAQLASALIDHLDFNEAIELYWQAFSKVNTLEDKIDLTSKMLKAYDNQNAPSRLLSSSQHVSPLIDRLDAGRKDPALRRDFTICLAHVYQAISEFEKARRTLEELVSDRTRDTSVLQQLAKISLAANDLELAIDYQRQLVALMPGQENETYLANLLRQRGDWIEANEIVVRLIQNESDPSAAIKNLDSLIHRGEFELVVQTIEPLLRRELNNWELQFRLGLAHAGIDQWTKSREAFEKILRLDLDRNVSGMRHNNASKKPNAAKSLTQNPSGPNNPPTNLLDSDAEWLKCLDRSELSDIAIGRARIAVGASSGSFGAKWSPENYGETRLASIAWLLHCDAKAPESKSEWISTTLQKADAKWTRTDLLDTYAILKLRHDVDGLVSVAAILAESGEPVMLAVFLDAVRRRQVAGTATENTDRQPLSNSQLDLLLEAFQSEQDAPSPNTTATSTSSPSLAITNARTVNAQMTSMISQLSNFPPADRMRILQSMQRSMMRTNTQTRSMNASSGRMDGSIRTVVNELSFAGRTDQADALIETKCENTNTELQLSQLCEYLLSTQRFSLIERPLLRWFELQRAQLKDAKIAAAVQGAVSSSNPSWNAPSEFAIRFLESSGELVSLESAIHVADSALACSNQKYRDRNFPPIDSWSLAQNSRQAIQWNNSVQPWRDCLISEQDQRLLNTLRQVSIQSNRNEDWLTYLQSRVDREEGSLKALEQLRCSLSIEQDVLPKNGQSTPQDALVSIGQDPGCELYAAASLLIRQEYRLAMKVAKPLSPSNPKESLLRELILLHSAASIDDNVQLEASLLALKSQKLDNMTLQSISGVVQKATTLGIASAKDLQINRTAARSAVATARNATPSPPSPETLRLKEMMEHSKNGNHAEAIKIARQLVSKPRTFLPPSTIAQNSRTNLRTNNANNANNALGRISATPLPTSVTSFSSIAASRKLAFNLLKEYGELEQIISETEQRLLASPDSFVLLDQLAEHHEVAGNTDEAIKAMMRALQLRPNASQLRIHLAEFLTDSLQDKACDQYLELIRRDPNTGLLLMNRIPSLLESNNRTEDLLKALRSANFQSVQNQSEILLYAQTLIAAPKTFEVGAVILQKLVELDPSLRANALMIVYGSENKKYLRIMDFIVDSLVPTEAESTSDPWFGLHDLNYNSKTAEQTTLFESILSSHTKEEILERLEPTVRAASKRMPGWVAGRVMLALIDVSTEQTEEAKKRFEELAQMKRLHASCPDAVAWTLSKHFEARGEPTAAIHLLESLFSRNSFYSFSAENHHVVRYAKLLIADGKRDKAIAALNKAFESGQLPGLNTNSFSNRGTTSSSNISSSGNANAQKDNALADSFLALGLPVEAYRLYDVQNGLSLPNMQVQGQRSIVFSAQGEAGKQEAIAQLRKRPSDQAIAELLHDRTVLNRNLPALELMFNVQLPKDAAIKQMESELQAILIRHAKTGKLVDIEQRLKQLSSVHPNDVTVYATMARVRLATGAGDAEAALHEVERILPSINLEASSIERNLALSLWLVARECYLAGKHFDIADRLAERAMRAAKLLERMPLMEFSPEGLSPLSKGSSKRVNLVSEPASILLLEWGDTLIRSGNTNQGLEKWEELYRKLGDQSQSNNRFELQVALALKEAEVGQLDLAAKIVAKITHLWTVADTPKIPHATIRKILDCCQTDSQRVDFLVAVVFAPQQAISLQADEVELLRDSPQSLGEPLVLYASQSSRIDEIMIKLELLPFSVDRDVLKTLIAIAQKDYDAAKVHLGALLAIYQKSRSLDNLQRVCLVAIPAFRIEELRGAAMPILNELLQREKDRLRLPTAEFNALPLVVEIDDYLRSKK